MFIASKELDFENNPNIFKYIIENYSIAIVDGQLYVDVNIDNNQQQDFKCVEFYNDFSGKAVSLEYNAFENFDAAKEVAKERLEDWGDDLLTYFPKDAVMSWAKGQYFDGATNFYDWLKNTIEDESSVHSELSVYDGSESVDIYFDSYAIEETSTDCSEFVSLNSDEFKDCKDLCEPCLSQKDSEHRVDCSMGKMIGYLTNKNDYKIEDKFQESLTFLHQSIDKFMLDIKNKETKKSSLKL